MDHHAVHLRVEHLSLGDEFDHPVQCLPQRDRNGTAKDHVSTGHVTHRPSVSHRRRPGEAGRVLSAAPAPATAPRCCNKIDNPASSVHHIAPVFIALGPLIGAAAGPLRAARRCRSTGPSWPLPSWGSPGCTSLNRSTCSGYWPATSRTGRHAPSRHHEFHAGKGSRGGASARRREGSARPPGRTRVARRGRSLGRRSIETDSRPARRAVDT